MTTPRKLNSKKVMAEATKNISRAAFALAVFLWGGRQGVLCAPAHRLSRADQVAAHFQRPTEDINALRTQGFGYGEIVKILVITQMSKHPLKDLLERNRQGYGWGTISLEAGLDPVEVKRRVDRARQELRIRVRPQLP